MTCQQFRNLIDSYVCDELLVETNHGVLTHLEICADCRNELAACRDLRSRLARAIKNSQEMRIDPTFAVRLSESLSHTALRPSLWEQIGVFRPHFVTAVVAGLVLVFALGVLLVLKNRTDENYPLTAGVINEMVNLAVGDHENCAIHFALKEKPIPLAVAAERYEHFYDGLDKTVTSALKAGDYEFVEAHSCVYEGHRFAHILLQRGDKVASILVTRTDSHDQTGPTALGQYGGYQTALSSGTNYAFFVISDLPPNENLTIARELSPAIAIHMASA